ncbi:GAF domain-containing protein [Paraneptunicella aestuarii]|uniref:GAF domain-containing protein n=1 Tax=Paraneptunicella aestuarii TaxID=2831148 RepID=UPI001E384C2A|nr:GAF domain-containing protein [Paraneptunicella aestuarii]UAA37626.1 GAF domain-containing protein [Paraneptunicella aestuarii]
MKKPEIPGNEQERLCLLDSLNILDTPPESRFDDITKEAKEYYQVPIALVSIVDADRQWFKSCQGLDVSETHRDISFCGHAIHHDEILYIPDALEDIRFATNPLVTGEPKIRFYAGAPLIIRDELRIGTLCIIDRKPRYFDDEEFDKLRELANRVQAELNAGR